MCGLFLCVFALNEIHITGTMIDPSLSLSLCLSLSLAGLHVEKGTCAQELDGALVCTQAILHGLLHQRGPERQEGRDSIGPVLCCGGNLVILVHLSIHKTGRKNLG